MKAKLWKIKICNGALEIAHGWNQTILEIEIPKLNISVNWVNNEVNYFETYEGRYSKATSAVLLADMDFPDALAKTIDKMLSLRKTLSKDIEKMFSEMTALSVLSSSPLRTLSTNSKQSKKSSKSKKA